MDLKYYVLGIKDSPLLKKYKEKYYNKLISDLKIIQTSPSFRLKGKGVGDELIKKLLNHKENRDFILNADQSSLINDILLNDNKASVEKLKNQIDIFLKEGINSENLDQNKGTKIAGTDIYLTSIDNNPYNKQEAHPEHKELGAISGNWGEASEQKWLESYTKTFELLKNLDEGLYDELNQIITKIVPLGTARGMHNSASYKECIGHLYMGYTIDSDKPEINNLEAIIHESSHNKLNLLKQFDPLLLNDFQEKYYSAIRPDARHIHGVFIGYHAFAPTMYIIMKAYNDGFLGSDQMWLDKIVLYYIKTKFLQKIVKKYAKLTRMGEEISEEIDYVISMMDDLFKEIAPSKEVIFNAKKRQIEHFKSVNSNYPYLEY